MNYSSLKSEEVLCFLNFCNELKHRQISSFTNIFTGVFSRIPRHKSSPIQKIRQLFGQYEPQHMEGKLPKNRRSHVRTWGVSRTKCFSYPYYTRRIKPDWKPHNAKVGISKTAEPWITRKLPECLVRNIRRAWHHNAVTCKTSGNMTPRSYRRIIPRTISRHRTSNCGTIGSRFMSKREKNMPHIGQATSKPLTEIVPISPSSQDTDSISFSETESEDSFDVVVMEIIQRIPQDDANFLERMLLLFKRDTSLPLPEWYTMED